MKNFFFSLIALLTLSCQGIEVVDPETESAVASACEAKDPLKELIWLHDDIQRATESPDNDFCTLWQVTQGTYKGNTVFVTSVGGPLCCTCAGNAVFNCDGETVFVCDSKKEAKIKHQKVIWKRN